jgi:hypothetical protein
MWKVTVVEVEVDNTKKCDYAFPSTSATLCDLYVELKVGTQTKQTNVVSDTNTAVFNEYLLTATAKDLMGTIKITIIDYDPLDADDIIADCTNTIYESELEKGEATIYYCGSSSDLKKIRFSFAPDV